jgi:hypothetical protein
MLFPIDPQEEFRRHLHATAGRQLKKLEATLKRVEDKETLGKLLAELRGVVRNLERLEGAQSM